MAAVGGAVRASVGGDLEMTAHHLGHASIETTRIYVRWNNQGLKKAVGEW